MAGLLGVAAGYGAIAFRALIDAVNHLAFPQGIELDTLQRAPWWAVVLPPALGGLFVAPLVNLFAREAKGHGVPEVIDACATRGGRIRPRVALVKILASGVSIGTGGSVGREGPIVQIGSGLGSVLGQLLGIRGQHLVDMVSAGAAAGIAATFNAPIAGVIFAVEVILGRGSPRHFSPLIVSTVAATVIARHHLGDVPAFQVAPYALVSGWEIPLYVVLGALAAVVGVVFIKVLYGIEDLWKAFPLPPHLHGVFGGALVGAIALWFPQVMGVGYEHIEQVLGSRASALDATAFAGTGWLLLVMLAKITATSTTIGSGGSGGIFAPSLFLGASLGAAFGGMANRFMPPGSVAQPGAFALVGMGAVVSATTHGPLAAILVVFELTNRHTIILPLMLSCILAAVLSMRLSRGSIYTLKLMRRGTFVGATASETELLRATHAGALMVPVTATVRPEAPLFDLLEHALALDESCVYVTDRKRHLLGLITLDDIATHARDKDGARQRLTARDLMHAPPCTLHADQPLEQSLPLLSQRHQEELPVASDDGRLIGRVTRDDVLAFLSRELLRQDAVLEFVEERDGRSSETLKLATGEVKAHVPVGGELVGKTLTDLNLRVRLGVNVYAVRHKTGQTTAPDPAAPLDRGAVLVVVGPEAEVEHLRQVADSDRDTAPG